MTRRDCIVGREKGRKCVNKDVYDMEWNAAMSHGEVSNNTIYKLAVCVLLHLSTETISCHVLEK